MFFDSHEGMSLCGEVNLIVVMVDNDEKRGAKVAWFVSFDLKVDWYIISLPNRLLPPPDGRSGPLSPSLHP